MTAQFVSLSEVILRGLASAAPREETANSASLGEYTDKLAAIPLTSNHGLLIHTKDLIQNLERLPFERLSAREIKKNILSELEAFLDDIGSEPRA